MIGIARRGSLAAARQAQLASGTITFVQEVVQEHATGSTATPTATLAVNTTVGNFLILRFTGNASLNSISDSKGNTWQIDNLAHNNLYLAIASCKLTTALQSGDTITANMAATTSFHGFVADEWGGLNTSTWYGGASTLFSATSTSRTTNSIAVGPKNLVIGLWGVGAVETAWTPDSGAGYQSFNTPVLTTAGSWALEGGYLIDSGSGGAYSPDATGVSHNYNGFAAYYR